MTQARPDVTSDSPAAGDSYVFGPFRLDAGKRVLWRGQELVKLQPKALDLLAALVAERGDVVAKDELLRRVWPDAFVEEANLSVNVSALRKALGRQADGRAWVESVARRGYRFLGTLEAAPEARPAPRRALAVLPFRALNCGDDSDTLGLALADAVISRLTGRTPFLVRSTSAVLPYAGRAVDAREAARELRVDALIEGTVQRDGSRLRVTVQYLPAVEHAGLAWAERLEQDFESVFDLQDALAERVAAALERETRTSTGQPPERRPTLNGPAYQAYLRGRHFWSRFTGPDLERAYECFESAARHDPEYALPHAGLADVQLVLGFSGLVEPRAAWPLASAAAREALRRDPRVAEAHIALAFLALFQDWDWTSAEQSLARALELQPDESAPHQWRALFLLLRGRLDEAELELRLAEERDPLALPLYTMRGFWAALRGDYAAEADAQRRALELAPHQFLGHWGLGLAEQHLGRFERAVLEHRQALELAQGSAFVKGVLARSLALAGQAHDARALLAELEHGGAAAAAAYQRALALLALGERGSALACLQQAAEVKNPWLVLLGVDPMLDELRGEAAFEQLRERVCPGIGARAQPAQKAVRPARVRPAAARPAAGKPQRSRPKAAKRPRPTQK